MLASGASKPRNLRALALRNSSKIAGLARARRACRRARSTWAAGGRRALPRHRRPRAGSARPRSAGRPGPHVEGFLGADRIAGRDHLQRLLDAGDARQPLRAARARQQAELDLGNAELRRSEPRPGSGRPSATSSPPPSAVPWIAATTGLEQFSIDVDHLGSIGIDRRLAELGDVGAGEEGLAFAAMTTALIASSPSASSIAATSPWRTAAPSAFTGGLFDVTISTSPWLRGRDRAGGGACR